MSHTSGQQDSSSYELSSHGPLPHGPPSREPTRRVTKPYSRKPTSRRQTRAKTLSFQKPEDDAGTISQPASTRGFWNWCRAVWMGGDTPRSWGCMKSLGTERPHSLNARFARKLERGRNGKNDQGHGASPNWLHSMNSGNEGLGTVKEIKNREKESSGFERVLKPLATVPNWWWFGFVSRHFGPVVTFERFDPIQMVSLSVSLLSWQEGNIINKTLPVFHPTVITSHPLSSLLTQWATNINPKKFKIYNHAQIPLF